MSWWGAQPPWYWASAFWDPSQAAQFDQAMLENAFIVLTVTVTVQFIAYNFFVSKDKLKSFFIVWLGGWPAWIAGNEQSLWCCSWMAGSPFFGQNRSQSFCFSWCQYAFDATVCNDFFPIFTGHWLRGLVAKWCALSRTFTAALNGQLGRCSIICVAVSRTLGCNWLQLSTVTCQVLLMWC